MQGTKLTFVFSRAVKAPAYKTCSMQGRHYYELHVTDEQNRRGGSVAFCDSSCRIGIKAAFLIPSLNLLYYITCSQTFPATRS